MCPVSLLLGLQRRVRGSARLIAYRHAQLGPPISPQLQEALSYGVGQIHAYLSYIIANVGRWYLTDAYLRPLH